MGWVDLLTWIQRPRIQKQYLLILGLAKVAIARILLNKILIRPNCMMKLHLCLHYNMVTLQRVRLRSGPQVA